MPLSLLLLCSAVALVFPRFGERAALDSSSSESSESRLSSVASSQHRAGKRVALFFPLLAGVPFGRAEDVLALLRLRARVYVLITCDERVRVCTGALQKTQ